MKKIGKIRYIAIVGFSTILAIILHGVTSNNSTVPQMADWSLLVNKIGFSLTVLLYFLIAFGIIAYVFYSYEDKLPGKKGLKGLRYGIAIGLLWQWGMLEGVSLMGNPLINEFLMGSSDAIPIVLMGLLLGIFTTKRISIETTRNNYDKSNIFLVIFIFTIIFLAGRYFLYYTKILASGYQTNPYLTFIWTLLMGTCIGVTYLLLGQATQSSLKLVSAVKFGLMIFGANWAVFTVFIPVVFKVDFISFIIRITVDIGLVILSCYLSESLGKLRLSFKKIISK